MPSDEETLAFLTAARDGHLETVRQYLDEGMDIEARTPRIDTYRRAGDDHISGRTALIVAVDSNNVKIASELLSRGADVKAQVSWEDDPLIYTAAELGCPDLVNILLDHGADAISKHNDYYRNVLHLLATRRTQHFAKQHLEVANVVLARDVVDINALGDYNTALDYAANAGNLDLVKILLDHGAKIEIPEMCYPISRAAGPGHLDVVQCLLDHGAGSYEGLTAALWSASMAGHVDTIRLLLDRGAVVEYGTDDCYCPLHAAAYKGHIGALQLLVDNIHNGEAAVDNHKTALHSACNGHIVEFLLSKGYNIEARNSQGETPLFLSRNLNSPNRKDYGLGVIKALVNAGANVNAQDHEGRTAIFAPIYEVQREFYLNETAVTNIRRYYGENRAMLREIKSYESHYQRVGSGVFTEPLEVIKLLLGAGIDVNIRAKNGRTASHCVLENFHGPAFNYHLPSHGGLELFRLLLEKRADISIQDELGMTPLHQAARAGDCPIMEFLLQHGADVNARMKNGRTPLFEAVAVDLTYGRRPHLPETRMLLEHGADVKLTSDDGRTVLHEMACIPHGKLDINVVSLLLENGADPLARDGDGQTAVDLAAREENCDLLRMLQKASIGASG